MASDPSIALPAPPRGRVGWPWQPATHTPSTTPASGQSEAWPRITVVTPSLNQGRYIEETIRSVLLQGYPDLEYMVIDGGSKDETRAILERYDPWIASWTSEPDRCQAHAINKGWRQATGEILAWLNSDDIYAPGALLAVGAAARERPGCVLAGAVAEVDEATGERLPPVGNEALGWERFVRVWEAAPQWHQPGIFIPRGAWEAVGPLDESLDLCFDRELMVRILPQAPVHHLDATLATFRRHASAKTARAPTEALLAEKVRIVERHGQLLDSAADRQDLQRFWIYLFGHYLLRGRVPRALGCLRRGWRQGPGGALRHLARYALRLPH